MKLSTYFIRVGKYVVQLAVLLFLMIGLMNIFNGGNQNNFEVFTQNSSYLLWCVVGVFSLAYPFFGFAKKTLTFDVAKNIEEVDKVLEMNGFVKISDNENVTTYQAKSVLKKFMMMYEDKITITTDQDNVSVIEGARKEVVKATMRFNTFIGN